MKYSYSSVGTYNQCPKRWKLKYVDKLPDGENEAFIVGSAFHKGIEKRSIEAAVDYLKKNTRVYNDDWVNEEIKIRELLPKVLNSIDNFDNVRSEIKIDKEGFIGYADMVADNDLYDFKYASSKNYFDGKQLNLYKHFLDERINDMYYVWIPKVNIRQRQDETLEQFRRRIIKNCKEVRVEKIKIKEDEQAFLWYNELISKIKNDKEFKATPNKLCNWCPYKDHCNKEDKMEEKISSGILPKAERRKVEEVNHIKLWIYGVPFSGKSTFANTAKMPLMLNTDGNAERTDAPLIPIKDGVKAHKGSRIVTKTYGWQTFKDTIGELQKDNGGFDTVVVDLVEGVYELCRTFVYNKRGWEHESDDSFRAWDIIRKEFLDVMKTLTNLNMNVILISHEDATRDFTSRNGTTATTFKPFIQDKLAKQLAGMVDVVARVVKKNGKHYLEFKNSETVFGGGRIELKTDEMEIDKEKGFADFANLIKGGN